MPKSPDEIKKGLECCMYGYMPCSDECTYEDTHGHAPQCEMALMADALAYIRQLEAERDALLDDLDNDCETCKNYDACIGYGSCVYCENYKSTKTPCCDCVYRSNWEWRGVQEEE